jgi:hypothetical protein
MKDLILFRGIAAPREQAERIREAILRAGIQGNEGGQWKFELNDLRQQKEKLLHVPSLSVKITRPPRESATYFPVVCACGDETGASYYAVRHNRHRNSDEVSYVIQFSAPLSDVFVDGRDFLYTSFQLWDRGSRAFRDEQMRVLVKLFGARIKRYFEKAASSACQEYRVAVCDLACQDQAVVRSHAKNDILIGGRYGTTFGSAFFVRAPIKPGQIIAVSPPTRSNFQPRITLEDFLRGGFSLGGGGKKKQR